MKAIKSIISVALILLLMAHTNYVLFYYSLYQINVTDLTASCCKKVVENCNAHCYLEKKINESTDDTKKGNTVEIKLKISEFILKEYNPYLSAYSLNCFQSDPDNFYLKDFRTKVKHPPRS